MKQAEQSNIKRSIVNSIGSIGYIFCSLQWFWAVMLYFSLIQSIPLTPTGTERVEPFHGPTVTLPGSIETIVIAIVVSVMIIVTIYILIKIPVSIAKTGNAIVHKAAETMVPVVARAQHKKPTKKFRIRMTPKLILVIKALLVTIPMILAVVSGLLEKQSIDYSIAIIIGGGLACLSVVGFLLQYSLAYVLRIKPLDLW